MKNEKLILQQNDCVWSFIGLLGGLSVQNLNRFVWSSSRVFSFACVAVHSIALSFVSKVILYAKKNIYKSPIIFKPNPRCERVCLRVCLCLCVCVLFLSLFSSMSVCMGTDVCFSMVDVRSLTNYTQSLPISSFVVCYEVPAHMSQILQLKQ